MKLIGFGVFTAFLVGASLVTAGPIATSAQAGTTMTGTDQVLGSRIAQRIHGDPTLKKYEIKVSVDAGVAKLSGTVPTEADRTKAAQLARVPGITRVDNQIVADLEAVTRPSGTAGKIEEKAKRAGEKTAEKAKEGAEKTKEAAEVVVDKTKESLSKTGEAITDGWITTRVKTKFLGEDLLKDSDISVSSSNHVVSLSGTVMTPEARARAVALAKDVEGVHHVVDKLTVGPKKSR